MANRASHVEVVEFVIDLPCRGIVSFDSFCLRAGGDGAMVESAPVVPDGPSAECSMMMDMGFPRDWCEFALARTGGDVQVSLVAVNSVAVLQLRVSLELGFSGFQCCAGSSVW